MTRRPTAWTYGLVVVALAFIAALAFHRDGYIAGGDIWPDAFISKNHALRESLQLWGRGLSGFGSPEFAPTEFIMAVWGACALHMGLSGPMAQFSFLCALLIFEGFGIAYFALALFPKKPLLAILAAIAFPISVYNAQIFLNPIQAFAFGYFPALAGLLINRLRTPVPTLRFGAELGLACAGFMMLAETPPVAVYAVLWMGGCILAAWWAWRTARATWAGLALGVSLGLTLNAWWAYAGYMTLFASDGAVGQTFLGPLVWSWVDAQASFINLLSMQGLWLWAYPEYYPWSSAYHSGVLHTSMYLPAGLALCGVILTTHRKQAALLAACLFVSLWLAKGYHPPFAAVNGWLYDHMPYFWLFRDPQGQANITLYVCLFLLAALGVHELLRFLDRADHHPLRHRLLIPCAAFILCAALLLNGFAFISGAFIPAYWESGDARMVVSVPPYWYDAANFLNAQGGNARILVLPNDDFYQMPYSWGYYGIDRVAQTLVKADVLTLSPRNFTYLSPSTEFMAVQQQLFEQLRTDPERPLLPLLNKLSIGWILQRNDINWSLPTREILNPQYIARALSHQPDIRKVATFGPLDVYRVRAPVPTLGAYDAVALASGQSGATGYLVTADALLNGYVPWTQARAAEISDSVAAQMFSEQASARMPRPRFLPAGKLSIEPRVAAVTIARVPGPALKLSLLGAQVRGAKLWRRDLTIAVPERFLAGPLGIQVGTTKFLVDGHELPQHGALTIGRFVLAPRARSVVAAVWTPLQRVPQTGWSGLGDCYAYDARTPAQAGLAATFSGSDGVRLAARDHAACANQATRVALKRGEMFGIRIDFRHERGLGPRLALLLNDRVAQRVALPKETRWRNWSAWFDDSVREVGVYVYADGPRDRVGTVNDYRAVIMDAFHRSAQATLRLGEDVAALPAGEFQLISPVPTPANMLHGAALAETDWDPPFNAQRPKPLSVGDRRLRATLHGDTLCLESSAEGIGWGQPVLGVSGQMIHLSLQARSLRGGAPLVKVVGNGGQLLWHSQAVLSSHWAPIEADIAVAPSENALGVYLYAFASRGATAVEYRDVRLTPWPVGASDFTWAAGRPPRLLATQTTMGARSSSLRLPPATKLLVLNSSFSKDWQVQSDGASLPWLHVRVNGLSNGWIVSGATPAQVKILYAPARVFLLLQIVALVSAVAAIVVLLGYRPKQRDPRFLPHTAISR